MKTYERIALAARLYEVRCELSVVMDYANQTRFPSEALRDGFVSILADCLEELEAIENLIRPELWETAAFPVKPLSELCEVENVPLNVMTL